MLLYRISVIGLLAICAALLLQLGARPETRRALVRAERVTVIDASCYSCGSGSGPSDAELAGLVDLSPDETVTAIDGLLVHGSALEAFARLDRQRFHGQQIRLDVASPRGPRTIVLELH